MTEKAATGSFEDLLAHAGDMGRWQLSLYAFIGLNGFFMGFQHLGSVFLAHSPDYWCAVDGLPDGWAQRPELKAWVLPRERRQGRDDGFSQCTYYARDYANWTHDGGGVPLDVSNSSDAPAILFCDRWEYDRSQFTSTIVTEWNLVCGLEALMSSVQGLYMGGMLVGCFVFGFVSDRWGRRRAILTAQLLFGTMTVSAAFAPALAVFFGCRFLIGMAAPGIFACPFVLVTELIGLKWRGLLGVCYQIPFGIGYAVLPGLAYLIRDWKWLQFSMSVPALVLLTSYWVLPESPRWLMVRGRFPEALQVLKKCAKMNGRQLPPDDEMLAAMGRLQAKDVTENSSQPSKCDLLKRLLLSSELRKRIAVGFFTWIVVAMVYYGLAFQSPKIGGNQYLMVFLGGILEIPAYLLGFLLVHQLGRRILYCATFLLASFSCFAILIASYVPTEATWPSPALAVTGKFFITITFAVAYVYTAELFPTVVRNVAVNLGSMGGRIGSICAPYIVYQLGHYHFAIPLVIFGSLSLVAGLAALVLPETMRANLAETVDDLQQNGRKTLNGTDNKHEPLEEIALENVQQS